MKTLIITSIYPNSRVPTAGPYNMQTFRPLSASSELRVISPLPWWLRLRQPAELTHAPWMNVDGIQSCYPTYWSLPRLAPLHAWGMYRSLLGRVTRLREEFEFDVILATWAYPDVAAAARIARAFRVPFVAKVHGSDVNALSQIKSIRGQMRDALSAAHRVIAVSAALGDKLHDLGVPRERIVVQHNAVDGARFMIRDAAPVRAKLGLPADRVLLGFVGRLSQEKGLDLLLESMAILVREGPPNVDLVVVGGGKEAESARQQADRLGLRGRVRFVGSGLPAEIPQWLSAFDYLCLPSRREGCPNVVLEALASGKPVVAFRVGGVPELLDERSGVLVEPENVAAFAAGIRAALKRTWDAGALRQSVPALGWESVAQTVVRLLEDAIRAREQLPHGGPDAQRSLS